MAKIDSLEPLLVDELRDLLDAEKQVSKALPKMARAASSEQLRNAFEQHRVQTTTQIERLNQVFEELGERARSKKCIGMKSLIEEGEEMLGEIEEGPTRDAFLISAAQKVEHYEIAAYGTLRTHAQLLGHNRAAQLLEQTLTEEKQTDERLTGIAESVSNPQAAGEQARTPSRRGSGPYRGISGGTERARGKANDSGRRSGSSSSSSSRSRGTSRGRR
jgi:ferritin-like metal-binding protein YciE